MYLVRCAVRVCFITILRFRNQELFSRDSEVKQMVTLKNDAIMVCRIYAVRPLLIGNFVSIYRGNKNSNKNDPTIF